MSSRAARNSPSLRLLMTTSAPASASPRAIALPSPLLPPVTSATFPVRSKRLLPMTARSLGEVPAEHRQDMAARGAGKGLDGPRGCRYLSPYLLTQTGWRTGVAGMRRLRGSVPGLLLVLLAGCATVCAGSP